MAKRVYIDNIIKWADKNKVKLGLAIGTPVSFLIFYYLAFMGAITINSLTWTEKCAGTVQEPCLAIINFTANEDVFLYKGDLTKLLGLNETMKEVNMYRSWGTGWRRINFEEGCTGSWCGCGWCTTNNPSEFVYAFRNGTTYLIKIEGFKNNITDTVKWSFGMPKTINLDEKSFVDPIWKGYNENDFFVELISNKADLTYGEAIFKVMNPTTFDFKIDNIKNKFQEKFINYSGRNIDKTEWFISINKTYSKNITDYSTVCNPYITPNGTSIEKCVSIVSGWHWNNYTIEEWRKIKSGDVFKAGEVYTIKLIAYWKAGLGMQSIEWFPQIIVENTILTQEKWAWWNSSWQRKAGINITNSGSALTDYQVAINITYDSDMASDFSDIRFVNGSENTELSHWLENKVNSQWAYFWLKIPNIPTGTNSNLAYIYYKNDTVVSSKSNGTATMNFWDDFETYTLGDLNGQGGWSGSANFKVTSTVTYSGTKAINVTTASAVYINQSFTHPSIFAITFYTRTTDLTSCGGEYYPMEGSKQISGSYFCNAGALVGLNHLISGAWQTFYPTAAINTWYKITMIFNSTSQHRVFTNDVENTTTAITNYNNIVTAVDKISLSKNAGTHTTMWDLFYLRKYSTPEPTYSIGAEESKITPLWYNNQSSVVSTYSSTTNSYFNITWNTSDVINSPAKLVILEQNFTNAVSNITLINNTEMVGYWRFDEASGTSETDSSGNSNTGTYTGEIFNPGMITGASWTTTGKYGNALSFTAGSTHYVNTSKIFLAKNSSFTVMGWFNRTICVDPAGSANYYMLTDDDNDPAAQYDFVIMKYKTGTTRYIYGIINSTGSLRPAGYGDCLEDACSAGTFTHVAIGYDNSTDTVFCYINGVLKHSLSGIGGFNGTGNSSLIIGAAQNYAGAFNGTIDDVRYYNRALSSTELVSIVNNNEFIRKDIVGYWRFDEGSGTTAYDTHHIATPYNVNGTKYDNAINFDGVNDYVNTTGSTVLTGPVTISAWVKSDVFSTVWQAIFTSSNLESDLKGVQMYNRVSATEQLLLNINNGTHRTWVRCGDNLQDSIWNHVAGTWDGTTTYLYINGVQCTGTHNTATLGGVAGTYKIGYSTNAGTIKAFNGTIDDVRIYNRSLSATEIAYIYSQYHPDIYNYTTVLWAGSKYWKSYASSFAGEWNVTPTWSFTVAKAQPIITLSNNTSSINSSNLVGYWRFETVNTSNYTLDSSGLDNDGKLTNYPCDPATCNLTTGVFGNAIIFDGSNDFINLGTGNNLDITTGKLTLCAWAKFNSAFGLHSIIDRNITYQYQLGLSAGNIYLYLGNGTSRVLYLHGASIKPTLNVWHHIVVTVNTTHVQLYIDGILNRTESQTLELPSILNQQANIGRSSTSYFNGTLDEVMIFNRSLTADEVRLLYQTGFTYNGVLKSNVSYSESNSVDADLTYNYYMNGTSVSNPDRDRPVGYRWYLVNTTGGWNFTKQEFGVLPYNISLGTITIYEAINGTQADKTYAYPTVTNVSCWKTIDKGNLTLWRNDTLVNKSYQSPINNYDFDQPTGWNGSSDQNYPHPWAHDGYAAKFDGYYSDFLNQTIDFPPDSVNLTIYLLKKEGNGRLYVYVNETLLLSLEAGPEPTNTSYNLNITKYANGQYVYKINSSCGVVISCTSFIDNTTIIDSDGNMVWFYFNKIEEVTTFPVGVYNYTCALAHQNYTASSVTRILSILNMSISTEFPTYEFQNEACVARNISWSSQIMDDAMIDSEDPNTNYGSANALWIKHVNYSGVIKDRWDLVKICTNKTTKMYGYDLIPVADRLELGLYYSGLWSGSWNPANLAGNNVSMYYSPNETWNESLVTWNNIPSYYSFKIATENITTNQTWYYWDITKLQKSVNDVISLIMKPDDYTPTVITDQNLIFRTKEFETATQRPKIRLEFDYGINATSYNGTFQPFGQTINASHVATECRGTSLCGVGALKITNNGTETVNVSMSLNTTLPSCMRSFIFSLNTTREGTDVNVTNTTYVPIITNLGAGNYTYLFNWIDFINCVPGTSVNFDFRFNVSKIGVEG